MKNLLFPATLLAALACSAGQAQNATSTPRCTGVLTDTNIESSLVVPAGKSCMINNTMITGNIVLERGATLSLRNTNVKGDLSTTPGFGRLSLAGSIVEGELRAERGGSVTVDDSQVLGNVNINGNRGTVKITRVTLNSNLNCLNNTRQPTGTWIRVDGKQTGQCSRL